MHVEYTVLAPHTPWATPLKLLSLVSSCNLNGFALLASSVRHVRGKPDAWTPVHTHFFVLLHKAEDTEAQFLWILIYRLVIPCLFICRFLLCSQKNIQTACLTEQKGPKQATGWNIVLKLNIIMFHYGFAVARSILRNQDNLVLRQPEPLTVVLFAHASVMFSLQDYFNNYTRVSEG